MDLVDPRRELAVLAVHLDGLGLVLVVEERPDQGVPDRLGDLVVGLVAVTGPRVDDPAVAEPVERLGLAPGDVGVHGQAGVLEPRAQPLCLLEHARGVGARQATVAGDHQDRCPLGVLGLRGQGVVDVGVRRHGRDRPRQLAGVRRSRLRPLLGLDDPGRGDELHGARDLLHRLGRLDPGAVLTQGDGHRQAFFCLTICSWSMSSSSRASCSSWPALIEPPSLVSNWSRNSS